MNDVCGGNFFFKSGDKLTVLFSVVLNNCTLVFSEFCLCTKIQQTVRNVITPELTEKFSKLHVA